MNHFPDLERELDVTRRVLERVPDDKLEWQPHEKSFSLGGLATHVANLPTWITLTLGTPGIDFAEPMPRIEAAGSAAEVLRRFDENVDAALQAVGAADDALLAETWTMRHGDHVISADPKSLVLRLWAINHIVHHRAQLSVYLRLLDLPVPSVYGPSADES